MIIIVEIEERHAASHRFRQKLVTISAVVVHERNAGFRCNFCKSGFRDIHVAPVGNNRSG